jgi:1,4-alpha-glucan branching enzyme
MRDQPHLHESPMQAPSSITNLGVAVKLGAITIVLHTHLPYCRMAGRWPHGEEWLHEAASASYVPLLLALRRLAADGIPYRLTLGMTPVLCEQLADGRVLQQLDEYIEERADRARTDIARFDRDGDYDRAWLARFQLSRFEDLLARFRSELGGQIIAPLKELQESGHIEIAAGAATHGYLPLLARQSSVKAQIAVGVQTYAHRFGVDPRSFWLPECAYRPSFYAEGSSERLPGFEEYFQEEGIRCFFAETHTLEGGSPTGKAAGDALGGYGGVRRRYAPSMASRLEPTLKTTYLPYWVGESDVAALGRNNRTGMQVWSATWGYPGDPDYREFHKKDGESGLHYWRVTGPGVDLGDKALYNPDWAQGKVHGHARHFAGLVEELLADFHRRTGRFGIIAAAYDTELFGHWWFEGVDWLEEVLRLLAASESVELTSADAFIEQHPPTEAMALTEGSWGQGGGHFTWFNADTEWTWPIIHRVERHMETLAQRFPDASGPLEEALCQAAREALLLQSSDWQFLITTGQAREYAQGRLMQHLERFERLAALIEEEAAPEELRTVTDDLRELDNPFPFLDYRVFSPDGVRSQAGAVRVGC